MPLDQATLDRLLAVKNKPKAGTYTAPQIGPLRYIEGMTRHCSSRGCMCPAHYAVQGAPKCTVHALQELNEMLVSAGFRGVSTRIESRPTPLPNDRICCASAQARLAVGFGLAMVECIHGTKLDKECGWCGEAS